MTALGYALAALMGLSLGTLGGGGSILTVPIFVYVLGYAPKQAIGMSLAVVGITSAIGAFGHWRAGNVRVRRAAVFGAFAMAGSYLGARLATLIAGTAQLVLFAVVMLAAATVMYRQTRSGPGVAPPPGDVPDAASRPRATPLIGLDGLTVGVLTGLVGVGGGFLIVPALVVLGRVPMHQAVGTSLAVIALNATTGFVGYLDQITVDWGTVATFTAVAALGIVAGTRLAGRIPARALKRAFAIFLVVMGVYILYQNRGVFLSGA